MEKQHFAPHLVPSNSVDPSEESSVVGPREGARLTQEEPLDRSRGKRGHDSHRKGCGERQEGKPGWMDRRETAQEHGDSNGPH